MEATVRPATTADGEALARIYNYFIRETIVTFEEQEVPAAEMVARLRDVDKASLPWLVAEEGHDVVGYAYATRWKVRTGYRFSTEVSVYLDHRHGGKGLGSKLYRHLFAILQAQRLHAVIGGIALPNDASVALHEKFGFTKVAHFKETGFKFGKWVDVGYWEKIL